MIWTWWPRWKLNPKNFGPNIKSIKFLGLGVKTMVGRVSGNDKFLRPNATVRLQAGSPSQLSQLIKTRRLRFFEQVARTDTSLDITRALRESIRGLPRNWRRSPHPGRPSPGWGSVPWKQICSRIALDWTQRADTPRNEHVGSISWKRLSSIRGHALMMMMMMEMVKLELRSGSHELF